MNRLFIILLCMYSMSVAQARLNMEVSTQEAMMIERMRNGQGVGTASSGIGGMDGCFQGMLQATGQGIQNTLMAQQNETNALLGLSQKYMEMEQKCSNDLAEIRLELDQAEADHEERLMNLPYEIEDQKLQYEESLLALQQECEQSSGEVFQQWKGMVSQGVVTPERGGPMALFSRGRTINSYQKIFEMDCLGSKNNIKRNNILAQRLANNIAKLNNATDTSAMKLASLSDTLSFKQGIVVENCMRAEDQLDYQSQLVRSMASATNAAAQSNNFLGMMGAVAQCIGGSDNAIDTTGASSSTSN